ncbi:hypothetical protein PVAG01_01325 [Phlyctema vagabunda]|uniref:F-box domain-containing protein n=1 Tax=Phlyctema vagabunda TaxID=108571 RepID=A0ABR4PWU8_9HELO
MPWNLFASSGGLELDPETCLQIVEYVEYSPETMRTLRCLSNSFNELLSKYEQSICRTIASEQMSPRETLVSDCIRCAACAAKAKALRDKAREQRAKSFKRPLKSSTIHDSSKVIQIYTYPWLSELDFRARMTQELLDDRIMSLIPPQNHTAPSGFLNSGLGILEARLEDLKRNALELLFLLADVASPSNNCQSIRAAQEEAITDLTPQQLALLDMIAVTFASSYGSQQRKTRVKVEDVTAIREEQYVFEDRVLKYGPFFVWSHVFGNQEWVRQRMHEGMQEMRDFEAGLEHAKAGLPSVVSRTFCSKAGCSFSDRWAKMDVVCDEMLNLSTRA